MKRYLKRMAQQLTAVGHICTVVLLGMAGLLLSNSALAINGANTPSCVAAGGFGDAVATFLIGGTTPCTGYDQVQVTGEVTFWESPIVSAYNGYVPVDGHEYIIVSNDGVDALGDGGVGMHGIPFTVGGKVLYSNIYGGDGNDLSLQTRTSQSITFAEITNKTVADGSMTLSAIASSGLPVVYRQDSLDTVCTISGNTLTFVGRGSCTVTATQSGNAEFSFATNVSRSFNITGAAQSITFNALPDKTYGDANITLSATTSSPGTITFSSANTTVCPIIGGQLVLNVGGTCTVNAFVSATSTHEQSPTVTQSFS